MANTRRVLSRMQTNAAKKQSEGSIDSSFEAFQTMFKKLLLSNCPSKYKSAKSKISVEFDDVAYDETTAGFQVNVYFPDNTYMTDYFKFKYTDSKSSIEDEISRFWAYVRPNSSTNSEDFSVSIYEGDIILHIYKSEGNWNIDTETDITSSFRAPRFKQYETESDILTWLKQRYDKVELLTEETPAGSKKDVLYLEGDQVVVKCSLTGSADSREWRCALRDRTDSWTWSYDAELTPEKLLKQLSEDTEIELQLSSKENYDLKLKQLEKGLQASKRILRRGKPLNASRQSLNRAVKLNSAMSDSLVQVLPAEESFFVSCNEDTLVLKVYKESGKWQEQALLDEKGIFAPVRYMGYLTKADIKSWLIQDYQDVRTITEAEAAELAAAEPTDEEVLAALGVDFEDSFKEVSDYEANDAENAIIKARRKTNSSRHVSLKASRDVQKLNPAGPIKINASLDDGGLEKAFTSLSPEVQPVQGILITVPEEADGVIEPGVYMAFYDATEGCYVLAEPSMSEETCIGYASIDELTNACFGYPTSTAPMSILDEEVLV